MGITLEAVKRGAIKGLEFAAKHAPAGLMIAAGALGIAAIVVATKDVRANEDELRDMEERKAAWDEYDQAIKEVEETIKVEAAYIDRDNAQIEQMYVEIDNTKLPDKPRVTTKEMIIFTLKTYGRSALCFLGAGVCAFIAFTIMNNRIGALSAALGTAVAQYETLYHNIEDEYGEEAAQKLTSPYRVVQKAHGRRAEVVEPDTREGKKYNGIWFHESEDFAKDDYEYNIHMLYDINSNIDNYFRTHSFLSLRKLYSDDFLNIADIEKIKEASPDIGWHYSDWSGLSFETADDPSSTFPDPDGGRFRSIYVSFPTRKSFRFADHDGEVFPVY